MADVRPTIEEIVALLQSVIQQGTSIGMDENGRCLTFRDNDGHPCELVLPLVCPHLVDDAPDAVLEQLQRGMPAVTIVLVQAGAAALGYAEGGVIVRHKVIKKYMVRAKQGKSQINYLKSKGKSRLGSRIRLKNSILFFEDINATLRQWDVVPKSESILLALPVSLKNLFYTANVPPPFEKRDPRIRKIPLDIRTPSFKELEHVNWVVSRGVLRRSTVIPD